MRIQNKQNQPVSCYYFIKITNAITNVMHKILLWVLRTIPNDNKNCEVPHLKSTDLNRIQVTTLTCRNMQVKQHYCTMLATATRNCAVTNVTYNQNNTFHSGARDTRTFMPTLAYRCTSILVLAIPCQQLLPRGRTPACTVGCQRLPPANANSRLAEREARGCS